MTDGRDVLRHERIQITLLLLLSSIFCGVAVPTLCMWKKGFAAAVQSEETRWYFLGGLFGGTFLLEILVALLMATGNFPDLGPPEPYEYAFLLALILFALVVIKVRSARRDVGERGAAASLLP
mmetsp:Transcript_55270/g.103633  ORF Transcript_55270/g.103633 Transcript_55270/m.103633 type:complete len:123 (+) Transcript_55270:72-440(+)